LRAPSISFDTSAAATVSPWPCLAVGSVEVGSSPYMARFDSCLWFPYSIVFIGGSDSICAFPLRSSCSFRVDPFFSLKKIESPRINLLLAPSLQVVSLLKIVASRP
jgi:hypothetical protein